MWNAFINLMLNGMVLLYQALGNNFILALTVFTVIIRLLLLPLNLRQQRSSIRMQEMQPQVQAIQKKYRDNPQKMQEEFAKLGYNPAEPLLGCLPLLVQMPIFFALFRVINIMLESTPQSVLDLTQRVNPAIDLTTLLPIENTFLWLNLALPDPLLILPILVAGSMFIQQKLLAPPTPSKDDSKGSKGKPQEDNPAAQMTQSMQYTMPLMFGFFAVSFNSGLAIYFIISNLIGILQGYIVRNSMAEARAQADLNRTENELAAQRMLEAASAEASTENGNSGSVETTSKKKKRKKKS